MDRRRYVLLLMATVAVLSVTMCVKKNSDDLNDDDYAPDYWEKPNCGGFNYPECGTEVDVPPDLESVTLVVDGAPIAMPASVPSTSALDLVIEFTYPGCYLTDGHVFVVKGGSALCLGVDGLPLSGPAEFLGICSTDALGEPYAFKVDSSLFLNGEGAPYFVEISNGCGTHSNRLPLDIVTVESE
jgi:hypothetical protein